MSCKALNFVLVGYLWQSAMRPVLLCSSSLVYTNKDRVDVKMDKLQIYFFKQAYEMYINSARTLLF